MKDRASGHSALMVTEVVTRFRPELDIILLADKRPDAMVADPAAAGCDANPGLKLIPPGVLGEKSKKAEAVAASAGRSRGQRSHTTAQETWQTEKSHD